MLNLRDVLWAGTDASLEYARAAQEKIAALRAGSFSPDEDEEPLYAKVGTVAVIPIHGPLVNIDSPILAFFGITGYPVIRRKVIAAAKDAAIEHILLDVNSGGGAVSGVADTGDLLAKINARVKPITTFSGGNMCSAAYWLGCSAGQVFASRTAMVGSIGVITTHMDMTKRLEQDGVKATVMRAGEFKALANPFEVLSPEAREQIQNLLDAAYKVFVTHMADCRGVSYQLADSKMAQGREFFGSAAKTAGLVDGISSLDAVVSMLQAKKPDKKR